MVRKNYRDVYRKGRIIQSWKGLNLYNLATFRAPRSISKTFYQQKWQAKSYTRTYHGRQVREKQWQLMFSRRIPAVVDMDVSRLAQNDGSRQAAGRGSGTDDPRWMEKRRPKNTPYMGMTYWPLERRLDTAVFRAMFASSVRAARQFCVHGHVKVNGKKIKYPGYLLNPGDMFSVDPELVMLATGMPNSDSKRDYVYKNPPTDAPSSFKSVKNEKERKREKEQSKHEAGKIVEKPAPVIDSVEALNAVAQGDNVISTTSPPTSPEVPLAATSTEAVTEAGLENTSETQPEKEAEEKAPMSANQLKAQLKNIETRISQYLKSPLGKGYLFRTRRSKRIHQLRGLRREVREAITATNDDTTSASDSKLKPLRKRLDRAHTQSSPIHRHMAAHTDPANPYQKDHLDLLRSWPNAPQQDKAYLTPWLPKNWMSAFAFIPRYLEVNQNVCSAVYLRHPVARPGLAEVPGPYGNEMQLLAYQWYLRRR